MQTAIGECKSKHTLLKTCGRIHTQNCVKALSQILPLIMCLFHTVGPWVNVHLKYVLKLLFNIREYYKTDCVNITKISLVYIQ